MSSTPSLFPAAPARSAAGSRLMGYVADIAIFCGAALLVFSAFQRPIAVPSGAAP